MDSADRLSLDELEQRSGVPARQIRELIRQGLVPPASSGGRGATYGEEHLDRLRAWKRLRQESPASIRNEQLRAVLTHLEDSGMLRGIADGTIPFKLVDDGKEEMEVRAVVPPATGGSVNDDAVDYLQSMRTRRPAEVRIEPSTATTHVAMNLRESRRSAAAVSLARLRDALERYVAANATTVRAAPSRSETWHRIAAGRDLEISARGPLSPDEIQLLETIGQLLQQAVYRRSR